MMVMMSADLYTPTGAGVAKAMAILISTPFILMFMVLP